MTDPAGNARSTRPCPECGHEDDDHTRQSWFDEEGVEGMTCEACEAAGAVCRWWTWDWDQVLAQTAMHD